MGSHTWNVPNGVEEVEDVLIVAGGGGGGGGWNDGRGAGGGGGAGGLIYRESVSTPDDTYTIIVGDGGAGGGYGNRGKSGEDSGTFGLTASGGGGGAAQDNRNGKDGGSGGGGTITENPGGSGLQPGSAGGGEGNDGGDGGDYANEASDYGGASGSGGGAAEAGRKGSGSGTSARAEPGGDGLYYGDTFGESLGENGYFAGGGGASTYFPNPGDTSAGGIGGGGDGNGEDGMSATGGGGGGGFTSHGGDGGSGIVIVQWDPDAEPPSNPSPSDGATDVSTSPTLSVDVSHSDGQSMDVRFYNESDGTEIGKVTGVSSGSTASIEWSNRDPGTTYSWYAVADDGDSTTQSSTWSFTTTEPSNSGGDGSENDPYQLETCNQLQEIQSAPNAHYELIDNIDCSGTASWNGGAGFAPIGVFSGSFDGNSYTITGLTIDRPNIDDVGLFGNISGATIENIYLSVDIAGKGHVGALVGDMSDGTVINAHSSGQIEANNTWRTGGLIGYAKHEDIIRRSSSSATVDGDSRTGGLVGQIYDGATVNKSYATGNVNGSSQVGGLVGKHHGHNASIYDSYATGTVTGDTNIGGLVGDNGDGDYNAYTKRVYATGSVSGSSDVGGLIGSNKADGDVTGHWDTESTGQTDGIGTNDGTATVEGLSTTEMQGPTPQNTMQLLSWSNWYPVHEDYPVLRWNVSTSPPDVPSSPSPADGADRVSTSPTLTVDVSDSDGEPMDVYLYDGSGVEIGSDADVSNGGTGVVTWSGLESGTTYEWYAVAVEASTRLTSDYTSTWSFTTNHPPKILDSPIFDNSTSDHSFTVTGHAWDPDGDDHLTSCKTGYTSDQGSGWVAGTLDRSYGNGSEAECTATLDTAVASPQTAVDVNVTFTDGSGDDATTSSQSNVLPNHVPTVLSGPDFTNYSADHAFNVSAVFEDTDDGQDELSSCTVEHNDSSTSYETASTLDTSYGTTSQAECRLTIDLETYDDYGPNEPISVQVIGTDKHDASVQTTMDENAIPNDPPTLELTDTIPSGPSFDDDVVVETNVSDQENDTIRWVNYTVWEYNEDEATKLIINENGTVQRGSQYTLWNSSTFTADLDNGTYNWTVEVSDGWTSTSDTGEFKLAQVSPDVAEADLSVAAPYDIAATRFRPDQTVVAQVEVTDLNGRPDLDSWHANITSPSGQEATYLDLEAVSQVTNGYQVETAYTIDTAIEGTWSIDVGATDSVGLSDSNSTEFTVTELDNVSVEYSYEPGGGTIETQSSDFHYAVTNGAPLLTGLIQYGDFLEKSASSNSGLHTVSMAQSFDSQMLLPYTAASLSELDEHEDELSPSLLGGRSFLANNIASIAYDMHDQFDIVIDMSYYNNDRIYLEGFNGSLGAGTHQLVVRNDGVEDGQTVVEVQR